MDAIIQALSSGLPILVLQLAVATVVLVAGVALYTVVTPFDERRLVREGNVAAAVSVAGAIVGMALPIAATLATSLVTLDILVWGAVAVVVQLTLAAGTRLCRGIRQMIEDNNLAVAIALFSVQIAVAMLNAAAVSG